MSDKTVGKDTMRKINEAANRLWGMTKSAFEPYEGVYRICDVGFYVSEDDFDFIWSEYPDWWRMAWMLADNGQYSEDDVIRMTVEEVTEKYFDPRFEPEVAFYTEASETGSV